MNIGCGQNKITNNRVYSNIMTSADTLKAMEAQGIQWEGMPSVKPEPLPEPAFGVHLREAWASLKKLWGA